MSEPDTKRKPRGRAFTPEQARAAAAKSHESRKLNRVAVRKDAQYRLALREAFDRNNLASEALEAALTLVRQVRDGEIKCRNAGEAAQVMNVLVTIGRLESGEATSLTASAHIDVDAARARVEAKLRGEVSTDVTRDAQRDAPIDATSTPRDDTSRTAQ